MKRFSILLVLNFTLHQLNAQSLNYEQIAFNFFIDSVFENNYKDARIVQFSGYTEKELTSFSIYQNCFSGKESLTKKLYEKSFNKVVDSKQLKIDNINNIKFKKINKQSSRRLKLFIFPANEIDGNHFVLIQVIKKNYYRDAYMFEIDKTGSILIYCKTGMLY